MPNFSVGIIQGYHAHVYFDAESTDAARKLRAEIEGKFDVDMGRFHEKLVGPHPRWSYQLAFRPNQFGEIVPWLTLNRKGLTIFIHICSGDHLMDHTDYVCWLGESVPLNLEVFD
tara:strand:+ start:117 stop:461 length:345 start_codon:yes stop_codon:yes gene_type:complete